MKSIIFIILLVGFTFNSFGQSNKFSVGIEYAPSFSSVTVTHPGFYQHQEFLLGHNAFFKAGYGVRRNLQLTLGIGYLNTKQFDRFFFSI